MPDAERRVVALTPEVAPTPPILTPKEAARLCGCKTPKTLYAAGVPYAELSPRKRVFLLEHLLQYLREHAA